MKRRIRSSKHSNSCQLTYLDLPCIQIHELDIFTNTSMVKLNRAKDFILKQRTINGPLDSIVIEFMEVVIHV